MGAAHLLRQPEEKAGRHRAGQPAPGSGWQCPPERKKSADESKARRGMTGRKAAAAAAILQPPGPVRHMTGHAAELRQIPGAAGVAVQLDAGDEQQGGQRGQGQLRPPQQRQSGQAAPRSDHARQQAQLQHPGPGTDAVMQQLAPEPVVLQAEAVRVAKPVRHGQVQAGIIPCRQYQEAERGGDKDRGVRAPGIRDGENHEGAAS
jgi:hypothetical protein